MTVSTVIKTELNHILQKAVRYYCLWCVRAVCLFFAQPSYVQYNACMNLECNRDMTKLGHREFTTIPQMPCGKLASI